MPRRMSAALCALFLAVPSGAVFADADRPLSTLLVDLFSPTNPLVLDTSVGHDAHFVSQPDALQTLGELNRGIASQLSTFPLGSSSGGFTYSFDPALGVYNRSAESFGPLFAERALTAGKGKINFGVNYQRSVYDTFEKLELQEGEFNINLTHEDSNADGSTAQFFFEGDIINAAYSIHLESETAVLFGSYGVSDRLDVGLAIPVVRLDMNVQIRTEIERLATNPSSIDPNSPLFGFVFHKFDASSTQYTCPGATCGPLAFADAEGTASGVGDIVVRSKYALKSGESGALAAGVDLRLPTGDEEDLLGSGSTQTKVFLIASGPATGFSPHVNIGYTFSNGSSTAVGELPDEYNYTVGFDAALGSRVTINADIIGRTLLDANRLIRTDREFFFNTSIDPNAPAIDSTFRDEFVTESGDLNLLLAAVGFKVNILSELLFTGNVLFGIGDRGLQSNITPVFGLDYTF